MEIVVLSVGKITSLWIKEGVDLFESRLHKYIKFSSIIIPDIKNSKTLTRETIKEEEGKLILDKILSSDFVVIMDEKGNEYSSREMAQWIQKQMNAGKKRIVFIIGGPFGFSVPVYERANAKISLSRMTFTHEMAKLILSEQLYRSMTIIKGEPYHHD